MDPLSPDSDKNPADIGLPERRNTFLHEIIAPSC
jgi:hypothetical protein